MDGQARKEALREYKERKVEAGIFAIRCSETGACWIGKAPDLGTIRNRHWFTLAQGSHRDSALQAAWSLHGAEAFTFERLEAQPDEETTPYLRESWLKEALARWTERLGATPLQSR